ncbi:MAG: DUF2946 family protein [Pseudomonadota bacterium]
MLIVMRTTLGKDLAAFALVLMALPSLISIAIAGLSNSTSGGLITICTPYGLSAVPSGSGESQNANPSQMGGAGCACLLKCCLAILGAVTAAWLALRWTRTPRFSSRICRPVEWRRLMQLARAPPRVGLT